MADFRKLMLVLAALAIVAAPASAQLACTEVNAVPAQLRSEGITEMVGNTEFVCTNQTAQTISITAILGPDTAIDTNRILNTSTNEINAYVRVNGLGGEDTYISGRLLPDQRTIVWDNVPIPVVTSPATTLFTITNIRVNASGIAVGSDVTERVFVAGPSVLPLPQNQVVVGAVFRGLFFSATAATTFPGCNPRNTEITSTTAPDFTISFTEGFANAFKTESDNTFNQAMEFNPLPVPVQGVNDATRLRAVFENVPDGVDLWVSIRPSPTASTLVTEIASGASGNTAGYAQVILTNNTGVVEWRIVSGADAAVTQTATFAVVVGVPGTVITPPNGVTTPSTVYGSFAPISSVIRADAVAAIPRFVEQNVARTNVFTVSACVTNLLFPFVTNLGGFDTGIALINTSQSNFTGESSTPANAPFNIKAQTGACTLYYFGLNAPLQPQETAPIGVDTTGEAINKVMVAFSLSEKAPGFQGYIIARCNFQFGHGYAFVSDLGAEKLAHGYLALVIPDLGNDRLADPFPFAGRGVGEQLGF
ncbi:MAG: hypothetical protein ACM3ZB_15980 [bacterium]